MADRERGDLGLEVLAGDEVAPAEQLAGQDTEPLLHHVQPGRVLGRVGRGEPRVRLQPALRGPCGVARPVVEDQVDAKGRVDLFVEFREERGEGGGGVAGDPAGDDLTSRDVHRSDDRHGAVADVLELAARRPAGP